MNKILFTFVLLFLIIQTINNKSELVNYYTIAHAGGGIDNRTYTNSFKALDLNYKKGFKYFEIDLSFTKDDKLICLHDWKEDIFYSYNVTLEQTPLTLKEFQKLNKNTKYEKCTLDSLLLWLNKNPEAFIITDVKKDNLKALEQIKNKSDDLLNRFIPQIYTPNSFEKVKKLGFEKVILTLYRYEGTGKDLLKELEDFYGDVSITIPKYRLNKVLIKKLKEKGFVTYTHTINDSKRFNYLKQMYGIDHIYTDFLPPSN